MTIHKKIKQARHVKGWTQEETAEKLKITANAYGAIERGETQPTIPKLKKICEILEVELSELIVTRNKLLILLIKKDIKIIQEHITITILEHVRQNICSYKVS